MELNRGWRPRGWPDFELKEKTMTEIERANMHGVTVDKAKLIATITENREKHQQEYADALAGWRDKAIAILRSKASDLQQDDFREVDLYIDLDKPEDHTEDYDSALANLEWSIHDTVELTQQDFQQFVRDRWNWSAKFARMSAGYTNRG